MVIIDDGKKLTANKSLLYLLSYESYMKERVNVSCFVQFNLNVSIAQNKGKKQAC